MSRASAGGYTAEIIGEGGCWRPFEQAVPAGRSASGSSSARRSTRPATAGRRPGGPAASPARASPRRSPIRCRPASAGARSPAPPPTLQKPGETYTPPADLLAGLSRRRRVDAGELFAVPGLRPRARSPTRSTRYPYGCTEQLVSTAYPLLYAPELAGDPKMKRITPRAGRRGVQAAGPPGPGRRRSACGGRATARPTAGSAPMPPTSCSRPAHRARPMPDEAVDRALAAMRAALPAGRLRLRRLPLEYPAPGSPTPTPPRPPTPACARAPPPTPSTSWPRAARATWRACAGSTTCSSRTKPRRWPGRRSAPVWP